VANTPTNNYLEEKLRYIPKRKRSTNLQSTWCDMVDLRDNQVS